MKKSSPKTAKKIKKSAQKTKDRGNTREVAAESTRLADRYRQIGISAVVAAVRYQGLAKNPAYAPAPINWRNERAEEAAA
jgi:hypothetical protein